MITASSATLISTVCFAAVTANVGVVIHVRLSTSVHLPLVTDVTWQIHSVQELHVYCFAVNRPLSMTFIGLV